MGGGFGAAAGYPSSTESLGDHGSDVSCEAAGHAASYEAFEVVFGGFEVYFFFSLFREVVFVYKVWEAESGSLSPGFAVVVEDVYHVVGVDGAEGSESITDDGEEGYQDVVDDVDDVILF